MRLPAVTTMLKPEISFVIERYWLQDWGRLQWHGPSSGQCAMDDHERHRHDGGDVEQVALNPLRREHEQAVDVGARGGVGRHGSALPLGEGEQGRLQITAGRVPAARRCSFRFSAMSGQA
jgi:hypothetical protein